MKKMYLIVLCFIISCNKKAENSDVGLDSTAAVMDSAAAMPDSATAVTDGDGIEDLDKVNSRDYFENFKSLLEDENISNGLVETDLKKEMINLFNPDKFICNCDDKLKAKLRKIKNENSDELGFIPSVVSNKIDKENVYKIDGRGSRILANGFNYFDKNGVMSKLIYAKTSPTFISFNENDFFELNSNTFDNFIYTLDCSGYLSSAIAAVGGIGDNAIRVSARAAANSDNSLVIIYGVMYSPLYQAYKGTGFFLEENKESLNKRIKVLKGIFIEIPNSDVLDSSKIEINSNYQVMFTSNSGKSSFNGEGNLESNGSIGFGFGSTSGSANGKANISRKSEFNNFNTYIFDKNVNSSIESITYKQLKDLIKLLENKLKIMR